LEYKITNTAQSVSRIFSLKEIIFYIGTIEVYFDESDIAYLERADEEGEHIHLPYCYVNSVYWNDGHSEYRNILNDKQFVKFIRKEGVYQIQAYCQSELERQGWLDRSLYQIKLLDQLIRDLKKIDGVDLTEMVERT
jgi:hypothetical protein